MTSVAVRAGSPEWVAKIAWPVAAVSGLLTVVALVLYARTSSALGVPDDLYLADVWVGLALPPVGAYLVRRSDHVRVGLVLLSQSFLAVTNVAGQYAVYATVVRGSSSLLDQASAWLAAWTWTPYLFLATLIPLLFPTGHALSNRWRRVVVLVIVMVAVTTVAWAFAPGPIDGFPRLSNPWGLDMAPWLRSVGGGLTAVIMIVFGPLSVVSAVLRWRSATGPQRSQLGWFVAASAVMVATLVGADGLPRPWGDVVTAGGLTLVLIVIAWSSQAAAAAREARTLREEAIRAHEAERLRLHRDLHDGLGPELAGIALQIAAAASTTTDAQVRSQLTESQQRLRELTRDVRHVVDGLRPPALDTLGLLEALRQQATVLSWGTMAIEVDLPSSLPQVGPATQAVVYRIAGEALTNALRHSTAKRCELRLRESDGALLLEVEDDGSGPTPTSLRRPGTGLESMRLRAEELGGTLRVQRGGMGGWLLRARIPLDAS